MWFGLMVLIALYLILIIAVIHKTNKDFEKEYEQECREREEIIRQIKFDCDKVIDEANNAKNITLDELNKQLDKARTDFFGIKHKVEEICIDYLKNEGEQMESNILKITGCEKCNPNNTSIFDELENDTHSHLVQDNTLWHYDTHCGAEGEIINFCPFCGRKLEVE